MKKFIQYTAVLGTVLVVLGFGTASAAHVQGGRWSRMHVFKNLVHGQEERRYRVPPAADTGVELKEGIRSFSCLPEFHIEVDYGNLTVIPGEKEEILVQCDNTEDFGQGVWVYAEDGELNLKIYGRRSESRKPNIQVTVPAGYSFREIETELLSGNCVMESIKALEFYAETAGGELSVQAGDASSVELSCAAGNISWYGQSSGKVDIDCAAGNVVYRGQILGDVDAECAAGNIYLELPYQQETDFNYEIEGTGGSIQCGEYTYSGMLFSKEKDCGAPRNMELQSAAGSIQVRFGDAEVTIEEAPLSAVETDN